MIDVDITWCDGVIQELQVVGHASARQGDLCVAVSCLVRSAAAAIQSLEQQGDKQTSFEWDLELSSEGRFAWSLLSWDKSQVNFLQGVSKVVICGLEQLDAEFSAGILKSAAIKLRHSSSHKQTFSRSVL